MPIQIVGGNANITGGTIVFGVSDVIDIINWSIFDLAAPGGTAAAWYILNSNGIWYESITENATLQTSRGSWVTPNSAASNYEVRVTVSGAALDAGSAATDVWLALSTTRQWGLQETVSGQSPVSTLTVDIRRIGTSTILDTATITLEATVL